jgi:hypothetical protein
MQSLKHRVSKSFLLTKRLESNTPIHTLKKFKNVENVAFPGAIGGSAYTEKLNFLRDYPTLPTYRVMDLDGSILDAPQEPNVSILHFFYNFTILYFYIKNNCLILTLFYNRLPKKLV